MATEKRLIYLDEAIAKIKDDGLLGSGYSDDERMDDVIDILESCHIINAVEVVHGRWIAVPSSDMMTGKAYKCSECQKMRYGSFMPNYCSHCGADMREKMDGDGNA